MKRGEVYLIPHFEFDDGGSSKKLIIVLNDRKNINPNLVVLATSQQSTRNLNQGCHASDGYYIILPNVDWFRQTTWIMLDRFIEYNYNPDTELREHFSGNLILKTTLQENTIRAIINCAKRSDDITSYQLSLLN